MSRTTLRIAGGTVYDPANAIDGQVRDICIDDGRIVESLPDGAPALEARGMVVMPGGVLRLKVSESGSLLQSGPARRVFSALLDPADLQPA